MEKLRDEMDKEQWEEIKGNGLSFENIAQAFIDIMEGNDVHDIKANSGLPEKRCKQIYDLYTRLIKVRENSILL